MKRESRKQNLLIAGGGTGGHLFPGIAVAEEFLSRDPENEVVFVGTKHGIEAWTIPEAGYRLKLVSSSAVHGMGALRRINSTAEMPYGCRAGANTIAEVIACGKACPFIPLLYAANDHQRKNAEALIKKGADLMLLERKLSGALLAGILRGLIQSPEIIRRTGAIAFSIAKLNAAKIIMDEMVNVDC